MQALEVIPGYREIKLTDSNRTVLVDERDYSYLSKFTWRKKVSNGKPYAYRYSNGKLIYMHRQIMGYHLSDYFSDISHSNGNTLDNRFTNLRPRYSTASHKTCFHTSLGLQRKIRTSLEKYRHSALVNVVDSDGIVLRSNVTNLISKSADELNHLLIQRLKAAQLVKESRDDLITLLSQINAAKEQIDAAIFSLDATIAALQPK